MGHVILLHSAGNCKGKVSAENEKSTAGGAIFFLPQKYYQIPPPLLTKTPVFIYNSNKTAEIAEKTKFL
jgi:hypothetical protein